MMEGKKSVETLEAVYLLRIIKSCIGTDWDPSLIIVYLVQSPADRHHVKNYRRSGNPVIIHQINPAPTLLWKLVRKGVFDFEPC